MTEDLGGHRFDRIRPASEAVVPAAANSAIAGIGAVSAIGGASSEMVLDRAALEGLSTSADPAIANAGTVGSQIKMRSGSAWLIANVARCGSTMPADASSRRSIFWARVMRNDSPASSIISVAASPATRRPAPRYSRSRPPISRRSMPPTTAPISRSATSIRPGTFAPRCMSMRCWASISRCSARPAPANRPPLR